MAKNLLIVESPAKSRTLKRFLGKGFDVQATTVVRTVVSNNYIVSHPPINPRTRAFIQAEQIRGPKGQQTRNFDIVNASDEFWASPSGDKWRPTSGAWCAAKYAVGAKKKVRVFMPDGRVQEGSAIKFKTKKVK